MKAWEDNRDKRVDNWRNFTDKKVRIEKKKKTHFGIKAPPVKMEERPENAPKIETSAKPMGVNDDYKKLWR
jgi:hypothetical protein